MAGSRGPMGTEFSVWSRGTFPGPLTKTGEQQLSTKMGRAGLEDCHPVLGSQAFGGHHALGYRDTGIMFLLFSLAIRVLPLD